MPNVALAVPSVTGGITQNPPEVADPGRVKDSLNQWPIPQIGSVRRAPSEYRRLVNADTALETALLPVDLGGEDRYVATLSHDLVQVFRRNGEAIAVWGVTRDADGNITGGVAPDFTYLNLRAPNELLTVAGDLDLAESFEVAAGKWVISGFALASLIGAGPASPLGWPANASHAGQDAYATLRVSAGVGNDGRYRHTGITGHLWTKKWGWYTRINLDVPGAGTLVLPDAVSLILQDPVDASAQPEKTVTWDLTGGATAVPTVSSNVDNFITFQERVPGTTTEYIIGFIFDPDRVTVAAVGTGNTIYPYLEILDGTSGADPSGFYAWGAHLVPNPPLDRVPRYGLAPETLRRVSAGATTFVANPAVPTRLDTTVAADTFDQVYPTRTWALVPGPGTQNNPVADAGYVFMKSAAAKGGGGPGGYTITVVVRDTLGAGGTKTLVYAPGAAVTDTVTEAAAIAAGLTGHAANTDGVARVLEATPQGSVVLLETADDTAGLGSYWEIIEIRAQDSEGDSLFSTYTDRTDDKSDLPLRGPARHGHVMKLVEVAEEKDDFLVPQVILRFEGDDATLGVFGTGRWVEGVDYGLRTTLDASTLPHVLVRRLDNSVGTVTGKSYEPYFEWGEHTWADRVVGDDTVNAVPSFVTPEADEDVADRYVDAVGFYANRLVLGSGLGLACSEVSLYGNFWRSTLRALPDSDRIDVTLSVPSAARIRDLVVSSGRLFVRTNRALQVVTPTGGLSPRTIGVETAYGGGSDPDAQSAVAAGGIFIPGDGSDNGGVVLVFPRGSDGLTYDDLEATVDVPYLLDETIDTMVWASALSSLFVHTREDPTHVYGCRLSSEDRQLAWFPMDFNGDDVHSVCVLAGELFVLVSRASGTELESLRLDEIQRDPGQTWRVYLDRRLENDDLEVAPTYGAPNTTITVPYTITPGATVVVAERTGSAFGAKKTVVSATGSTVVVSGDVTGLDLVLGETYESWVEPLRPVLRDQGPSGPIPRASTRVDVREAQWALYQSGQLKVRVTAPDLTSTTEAWDVEHAGLVPLESRVHTAAVAGGAYEVDVRITADEQKPLNIVGLEWLIAVGERADGRAVS